MIYLQSCGGPLREKELQSYVVQLQRRYNKFVVMVKHIGRHLTRFVKNSSVTELVDEVQRLKLRNNQVTDLSANIFE